MSDRREMVAFNLRNVADVAMNFDRGRTIPLVGPEIGAQHVDVHINVVNLDSGPGPYHFHERSENVYIVLEGQLEVCVEGVWRRFDRDDVVFIPAGLRHCAGTSPNSPMPARVIEIYAPPGPDFHVVDDPGAGPAA